MSDAPKRIFAWEGRSQNNYWSTITARDDADEYVRKDITDELVEALGNIAKQQLESEMDESDGRDFQYAYREMVLVARNAIAKYREAET